MYGMLKNILTNAISKSATRLHPQIKREAYFDARGSLELSAARCNLCGDCVEVCPSDCLKVDREQNLWKLDPYRCVLCCACVAACPTQALKIKTSYWAPGRRGIISVSAGRRE